jgi:hypothetical protein
MGGQKGIYKIAQDPVDFVCADLLEPLIDGLSQESHLWKALLHLPIVLQSGSQRHHTTTIEMIIRQVSWIELVGSLELEARLRAEFRRERLEALRWNGSLPTGTERATHASPQRDQQ